MVGGLEPLARVREASGVGLMPVPCHKCGKPVEWLIDRDSPATEASPVAIDANPSPLGTTLSHGDGFFERVNPEHRAEFRRLNIPLRTEHFCWEKQGIRWRPLNPAT